MERSFSVHFTPYFSEGLGFVGHPLPGSNPDYNHSSSQPQLSWISVHIINQQTQTLRLPSPVWLGIHTACVRAARLFAKSPNHTDQDGWKAKGNFHLYEFTYSVGSKDSQSLNILLQQYSSQHLINCLPVRELFQNTFNKISYAS